MAGLSSLYEIYKKDPKFVEKLLSTVVDVEEKLDGSRFGFEVREGNEMKFFKRNDSVPLTKIDRTLGRYYEKAIGHFESFNDEKLSRFPEGWRFGFEYFPNLVPVKIAYDRIPLNHLVLTDVSVRDPQGKILEVIDDKKTLDQWASVLECEGPPQVFRGKLSDDQKNKLLDFLNTSEEKLDEKFKTENFSKYFLKTLNPSLGKSFMQNSLDKDIEALVFKFDGKNPLKVMNPVYRMQKEKKEEDDKPSDIYSLTLVFLQEFYQDLDFRKIKLKGKTFEERYLEFISKTFTMFCKSRFYKNNFAEGVDFELPKFLTREEAKLNFKFVTDEETQELLKKSGTNRELFKIMLASMRAHKKRPFGVFKKELLWHHNQLVDKIADYINSGVKESFLTYDQFREVFLVTENENEWYEYGVGKLNEISFPTYKEVKKPSRETSSFVETLRSISPKPFLPSKDSEAATAIICETVPYHAGILTALKDAKEATGNKSILCMTGNPFKSMETFKEMSTAFLNANKDLLHTVVILGYPHFDELRDFANHGNLRIENLYCDKRIADDYRVQTGEDVNHIDCNDNLNKTKIVDHLKSGEIDKFKKLGLPVTHNFFYKLKNDLK